MIRYSAKGVDPDTGEPCFIIGLGLSEDNITRLRENRPIFVHGKTVGAPEIRIIIHWGQTEHELTDQMAKLIGPETKVRGVQPDELPPDHRDFKPPAVRP